MKTAKFYANLGYPVVETTVGPNIAYYLMFGRDYYRVTVRDYQAVSDFIIGKANATMTWDAARSFDAEWKHREFEKLSGCFGYEKVNFIPNLKKKKEANVRDGEVGGLPGLSSWPSRRKPLTFPEYYRDLGWGRHKGVG